MKDSVIVDCKYSFRIDVWGDARLEEIVLPGLDAAPS